MKGTAVDKSKCRVKVCKNGPCLVKGGLPLSQVDIIWDEKADSAEWGEMNSIPTKGEYALCRCGKSKGKPFCDATHAKVGFDGTERPDQPLYRDAAKLIDGPSIELLDSEGLCASARFCHRGGGIWKLVPESGDPVKRALAIEEGMDCPSGRLVVRDKKGGGVFEPRLDPSIVLIEDPSIGVSGPIWVRGGVIVESANGKCYEVRNRVTLCRCGKSNNKPFCDSSHWPE